jgi:hypothetical protein
VQGGGPGSLEICDSAMEGNATAPVRYHQRMDTKHVSTSRPNWSRLFDHLSKFKNGYRNMDCPEQAAASISAKLCRSSDSAAGLIESGGRYTH